MNAKHLILGLFMIVLMSLSVAADRLFISDVDITVGGQSTKNLDQNDDGKRIGDEAVPGDEIKVSIQVESNFTNADRDSDGDEIVIEDVAITATLEGIDDGDDFDEDIDEFDLDPGDDDGGKVSFTVPLEAGEGDYDLTIDVEGDDTNGTTHTAQMKLVIEVQKEKHEVRITKATVTPSLVSCGKNAQLAIAVLNTGQEDEEGNTITITNSDLDVDLDDTFDVNEGDFSDDMEYARVFTIPVAKDADEGTYPLDIKVTYDDGGEEVTKAVDLTVDCTAEETVTPAPSTSTGTGSTSTSTTTAGTTPATGTTTVVVAQPSGTAGASDVLAPSTATTTEEQGSLFDNTGFVAGIVVLEVLIVIGGIAFVVYLMRKA